MVVTPLSTLMSTSTSFASHLRRAQGETVKIQAEVASGRLYDVGKTLGYGTEALVSFRQEIEIGRRSIDVNKQVAARLDASQAALDAIVTNANGFMSALMSARGDPRTAGIVSEQAESAFKAFTDAANTSFAGSFVFSGIETALAPFEDYFSTPPPASRNAVAAAFSTEFGFSSADPAVSNISVSSMQAFMDNTFASLFDDANWNSTWSAASSQPISSMVSGSREVTTSVSAASQAFRSLTAAFVLVADSGTKNLNDATFVALIDQAVESFGKGIALMTELQGTLGTAQQQVQAAIETTSVRSDLLEEYVGRTEGVDLSDLSVRLNSLLNQLEATYAVTGRLQNLSLLNAL
ncbi:MAG: flagellar hook-associated family protein [Hyphomicrobium sp.]|nr:flagellar hook-associated family protein [Hyphomicrobium sp.]